MADRRTLILGALGVVVTAVAVIALVVGYESPLKVRGTVTDDNGIPVEGAIVRIQTTETTTRTDEHGRFAIPVPGPDEGVYLTAWAEGYYIVGGDEHYAEDDIRLSLRALPAVDDPGYEWISYDYSGPLLMSISRSMILPDDFWLPSRSTDPLQFGRSLDPQMLTRSSEPLFARRSDVPTALVGGGTQACAGCHSRELARLEVDLPGDQWLLDAHGNAASNPRFLTMYLGTDVDGNAGPPTRFTDDPDHGPIPLPPDPTLPYFGPGYRLDFPDSFGNCAACHTPMASVEDPYGVDPSSVAGVAADGIGCDFCHKVWDVHLDAETELPDPERPGVLSFEFLRPSPGQAIFVGPYDDVAPGEDTYVPLYSESAFCASCHYGVFGGTVVYDSYGEWLRSPYADPATGQTCQDCHMPPTGATVFADPAQGGLQRDPDTIPGHLMPGAADVDLLQAAVSLSMDASVEGGALVVTVEILNDQTGHHVPTDSPLRHMILLVEVTGPEGPLQLLDGPVVPSWGGVGDPAEGRYAGQPGTAYAKVLEELWTGVSPTGAYWNPTRVVSDNRIPAMGSDTTVYRFADPGTGGVEVEVTLLFRRAYLDLAMQKGWPINDIVMETASVTIP